MNLPNSLTILRMILVQFVILFLLPIGGWTFWNEFVASQAAHIIAIILFCIASLTDFLDGRISRKYDLVTNMGKFLDPIADKLLTMTGMIYVVIYKTDYDFWWILLLIVIAREFIVSATRMVAANKNIVIAASVYGKVKTTITLIAIIIILFNGFGLYLLLGDSAHYITDAIFYISVIITVLSGVDYIVKNRQVFVTNDN